MLSKSKETLLSKNIKVILVTLIAFITLFLFLFRNHLFQSNYLLKSFGELSVEPEIAFKNNKPTFIEFYAEWCEVCKEMAPKLYDLKKDPYELNNIYLSKKESKLVSKLKSELYSLKKYYGNELTYEEMRKISDTDFGGLESKKLKQ